MQLYVGDYLADTLDLTCEEHGAYLLLLMTMWRHDAKLPNDAKKLARIARLTARRWSAVWPSIEHFFEVNGDHITNRRLSKEYQKAEAKSELRSEAGRKGGTAKSLKRNDAPVANATGLLYHSSEPEPDRKKETPKGVLSAPPAIDGIAQAITAYNDIAAKTGWPQVQTVSPKRRNALRARLAECGGATGWEVALSKAEASDFLTGQTPKPFLASFDWLTSPANFTKLLEGNYDNRHEPRVQGYAGNNFRGGQPSSIAGIVSQLVSEGKI